MKRFRLSNLSTEFGAQVAQTGRLGRGTVPNKGHRTAPAIGQPAKCHLREREPLINVGTEVPGIRGRGAPSVTVGVGHPTGASAALAAAGDDIPAADDDV